MKEWECSGRETVECRWSVRGWSGCWLDGGCRWKLGVGGVVAASGCGGCSLDDGCRWMLSVGGVVSAGGWSGCSLGGACRWMLGEWLV